MVPQKVSSDCFILPPEFLTAIIAHACAGYPEEVCGLVAGVAGRATAIYPGRNISPTPIDSYELDHDTLARQIDFENAGLTLAAIYHSHPRGPNEPSPTDIRLAFYPDSLYIICSLTDQNQASVRGFRIVDGQVREVTLIL